jgi:hypothetical protein
VGGNSRRFFVFDTFRPITLWNQAQLGSDGLFALLHIAGIVLESQMAHDPARYTTDDFYTRL